EELKAVAEAVGELQPEKEAIAGGDPHADSDVGLHASGAEAAPPAIEDAAVVDEHGAVDPHPDRPAILGGGDERRFAAKAVEEKAAQIFGAAQGGELGEGDHGAIE